MAVITVVKAFMLTLDPKPIGEAPDMLDKSKTMVVMSPPEQRYFEPGVYEVDEEVAAHWYVKAHLKGYQEPPKGPMAAEVQIASMQAPKATDLEPTMPSQPMPADARAPRPAPLPASATRMVPITETPPQ
jgi:hypothetical protein